MKIFLVLTALLGALGVVLGALGAHALEAKLTASQLATWETAAKYQLIHVVALLAILLHGSDKLKLPAIMFLIGIVLFSGSLYLLSVKDVLALGSLTKIIGPITPLGGLTLLVGWLTLAWQFFKQF